MPNQEERRFLRPVSYIAACVAVLLLYVLSIGPAAYIVDAQSSPGNSLGAAAEMFYTPLILASELCPPFGELLRLWCDLFSN